jgi:hypothetical protein
VVPYLSAGRKYLAGGDSTAARTLAQHSYE